ncbi:hypothetical protein [Burkholderia phage BCSR129]|nr:hypothetical protein [Burkholderia phage BCSR129]
MAAILDTTTLKAGDKVFIALSGTNLRFTEAKVVKVSATGVATVAVGEQKMVFNRDGRLRGQALSNSAILKWLASAPY